MLEGLGYLGGVQAPASETGVVVHDVELTQPGVNLYNSGHSAEAILMASDGSVRHRWSRSFREVFGSSRQELESRRGSQTWRRIHMYPNGDLLVIFEGIGIAKLDRNSKVLWARPNNAHHDLEVAEDGRIYLLSRRAGVLTDIHKRNPILEDFVLILDADGNEVERFSLVKAWKKSSYAHYPLRKKEGGDIFHTNTLELLDGRNAERHPAFREGNVLVSMRNTNWLAVLNTETGVFDWLADPRQNVPKNTRWSKQHQPTLLPEGSMLLFDNRSSSTGSRVIEFDPFHFVLKWEHSEPLPGAFFSASCGSAMRLPNGNTLITETDAGRAFEVTAEGKEVWRYVSPHRVGVHKEMVARLFEVLRIPESEVGWLISDEP